MINGPMSYTSSTQNGTVDKFTHCITLRVSNLLAATLVTFGRSYVREINAEIAYLLNSPHRAAQRDLLKSELSFSMYS